MAILTNLAETNLLELLFNNTDWENIGDVAGLQGSTTPDSFYLALFTADPTETGSTANEATFTNYARVAVARSGSGWTVSGDQVSNAGEAAFPQSGSGPETVTHVGVMTASSGGDMICHLALDASREVNNGTTVRFSAGQLVFTAA